MSQKKKYHHGNLRIELIETAAEMISREGLPKLTMRALSQRIGVSRTALYRHFADKNELLCAVAADGFNRLTRYYRSINKDASMDALSRFQKIGMAYIEFALRHPEIYRLMFGHDITRQKRTSGLISAAGTTYSEFLKAVKALQMEYDITPNDPLPLAVMAWSAVHGLSILFIDDQIQLTHEVHGLPTLLTDRESQKMGLSTDNIDFIMKIISDFWKMVRDRYKKDKV